MKKAVYEKIYHYRHMSEGFTLYANMEECEKHLKRRAKKGVIERIGDPCYIKVPDEWYNKLVLGLAKKSVANTFLEPIGPKKVPGLIKKLIRSEMCSRPF